VPNLTVPLGTDVELVAEDAGGWIAYREDALEEPPREPHPPKDAVTPASVEAAPQPREPAGTAH
jgi:hypothetical protein